MIEEPKTCATTVPYTTSDNDARTLVLFSWYDGTSQRSGLGVEPLALDGVLTISSDPDAFAGQTLQYRKNKEAQWHAMTPTPDGTFHFSNAQAGIYQFRLYADAGASEVLAQVQVGPGESSGIMLKQQCARLINTEEGPIMPFVVKSIPQDGTAALRYFYEAPLGDYLLEPVEANDPTIRLQQFVRSAQYTGVTQFQCQVLYQGAGYEREAGGGEFIIIDIC